MKQILLTRRTSLMENKCQGCDDSKACVPFFLHENAMMHYNISEIYQMDVKTVRKRIHRCEEIIFKHIPG